MSIADEVMDQGRTPSEVGTDVGPALPGDAVFIRLPHFSLRGDSLYFLISNRPFAALSPAEQNLWNAMEQETTVAELEGRLGADVREGMRQLLKLGVAEVITRAPAGKRRRVMVIEPHQDDAILSVGGLMLQRRAECEFLLVTAATQSVASSYRGNDRDFFDRKVISDLRKAESAIVARMAWGRHIPLEIVEATLRYYPDQQWTLEWFNRHQMSVWAYLEHAAPHGGGTELEMFTKAIAKVIEDFQPEEIWMPLGIGVHVDHQLTRHACLNILRTNPQMVEQCVCRFFQDVPYAADFPHQTADVVQALRGAGMGLEEQCMDVTDVKQEKKRLLGVYLSQWKTDIIWRRVENCSKNLGGAPGTFNELWYRVTSAPTTEVEMIDTSAMKAPTYRVAQDLAPWLKRNRNARRIVILLAAPMGRWKDDLKYLSECFPDAQIEVRTQSKFGAQSEMFSSPRVEVRLGGDRWRWLLADAVPTIVGRRVPVVIIAGRGKEEQGRKLARLGLRSDPVVAQSMSDFMQALEYVVKKDG